MEFIHAIDLCDFYPCHNIGVDGRLCTPNFIALADPKGVGLCQKRIDDHPINDLRHGKVQLGVVTPRLVAVGIEAASLRNDIKIVDGYGRETLYSEEGRAEKIKRADIELDFEQHRRQHYPEKVSRLTCIYLAERTAAGVNLIHSMLGPEVEILDVKISVCLSITKADVSWYDEYVLNPEQEYIENYWSGMQFSEKETWEYLFDGCIEIEDKSLLTVLDRGASLKKGSSRIRVKK